MILIINICKHELHYFEFVKPIVDIIIKSGIEYTVVHIDHLNKKHLECADKAIICGTSLRDFYYEDKDFSWIKSFSKPVLGICAGFQVICKLYGGKTKKSLDIGLKDFFFEKDFLGIKGKIQIYCLHNNTILLGKDLYKKFSAYGIPIHAIKMESKQIYGTLFHPEVRNNKIIENFLYV